MSKKRRRGKASRGGAANSPIRTRPANSTTLSSLAILKVHLDTGKDYLDQLVPFVRQVIASIGSEVVSDTAVATGIREEFGLVIPSRTVQVLLRRIVRTGDLMRVDGVYRVSDGFDGHNLAPAKTAAQRHIRALISGLSKFAADRGQPFADEDAVVEALCEFLAEFGVDSLKAILRGTTIPEQKAPRVASTRFLVGSYVCELQGNDPERFESFSILVQGHMLANALVCPDLVNAPKSFSDVTFFLDTPLLVQSLGLEGQLRADATQELLRLLAVLGGELAVFEHVREELESVVRGAANFIDSDRGRGRIVREARRKGSTRSDLLLIASGLDDSLRHLGISIRPTPDYERALQIDEQVFADVLSDEISYYNERAQQYDINSIRSIYVLRKGRQPRSLERSAAVFVTSNTGLARAAYAFGREHESSREVSSTISDFSLANVAWLKAPMEAPSLPTAELLALAYAATRPSERLLEKFLNEAERLEKRGTISARDLQILRSDTGAQDELMRLTLGDDHSLTEETVTETLARVRLEIVEEERRLLDQEQTAHLQTRNELELAGKDLDVVARGAWDRSKRRGKLVSWFCSGTMLMLILLGLSAGLFAAGASWWVQLLATMGTAVLVLWTIGNLAVGATVRDLHSRIEVRSREWFWGHECRTIGVDLARPDATESTSSLSGFAQGDTERLRGGQA